MPSVRSTQHDGRYTILVSDDDPGVRRGLQLLLRSRGYAVWGYTTGHALLADPRAKEADCVILDYRMPDIDGFAMLRHLREIGYLLFELFVSMLFVYKQEGRKSRICPS
jgi:FixJ family two-component response regulator